MKSRVVQVASQTEAAVRAILLDNECNELRVTTPMSQPAWEHFYHMADIGVRGRGQTLAQAFEQIALGMTAVITEPELIQPQHVISISCSEPDPELLLVDWLNALVYEMATRKMLFSRFEVSIQGEQLSGRAWGEKIDIQRHQPTVEIKGATYTELKVMQQADDSWLAQCVVDV